MDAKQDKELSSDMPPLPEPAHRGSEGTGTYFDSFTASQMREYALAAIAASPQLPVAEQAQALAVQGVLQVMGDITTLEPDNSLNNFPMALLISFDSKEDVKKAIADGFAKFDFAPQGAKND